MKSVEQHVSDIVKLVAAPEPIELDLLRAHGSVLAETVFATVSLPQFDNSSMDGYAVRAQDVADASPQKPVRLTVVADIPAGDPGATAIPPGRAARIMTGAPMPVGADTVVPVEWTDGGVANVAIHQAPRRGNAIRRAGSDVEAGTAVLTAGARIGSAEMAVLSAVGRRSALVYPRPRVVVLSTGEELVEPGRPLGPGQIWESNSFMLTAAAIEAGCAGYRQGFIGDEPAAVLDTLDDVLSQADIIVTTGGVSMGAYDVVKEVLARLGTVRFEKVAVQPGMPQGFGTVGDSNTPIITLPGNPVSAYVSFHLFVLPALHKMRGLPEEPLPSVSARLLEPVTSPEGRRSYLRAVLDYDEPGAATAYTAAPASRQSSHQLSALAETNALVVVPESVTRLPEGSVVEVIKLPSR
ncbi:molybdotransferase-like divisome protein Glp [Nocardiopsis ansamitocini]|uniref:Molybdopterin molybdenumtransferase n=1 Tax=Nocardiopsis ansamitocini TaxID=1670832 RepID=A0A9W6P4H8_9ACTN|nr:gephyrin-like molybdotransferase Glp [Nocardiopsis ansamitocini]GLU46947.1 molybdopterin molybdenumtransferase MoeA [Nocardiopsis ansamitocini]